MLPPRFDIKSLIPSNQTLNKITSIYGILMFFILPKISKLFNNKIIFMNALFTIIGVFLYNKNNNKYLLFLNIIIFIINEILYRFCLVDIYPAEEKTKMFYDITDIWHYKNYFTNDTRGTGNYTDGYYPNEESKNDTQEENDIRKFNNWIKILNIQPGESVIECGCGSGEFLKYLKTKNITPVGITLSELATNRLNSEGIECHQHDYKEPNPKLNNRFDHILFPSTLEHLTHHFINCPDKLFEKQQEIVEKLVKNISPWFNPNSSKQHLYVASLHCRSYKSFNKTFPAHLLERTYAGSYLPDEKGKRMNDIIDKTNLFKTFYSDDRTFDYYYASIKNKNHFGYPGSFDTPARYISLLALIVSPWVYPFLIYMFIYSKLGVWMWQFDGKYHPLGCDINKCELTNKRWVTYYYFVMKKT